MVTFEPNSGGDNISSTKRSERLIRDGINNNNFIVSPYKRFVIGHRDGSRSLPGRGISGRRKGINTRPIRHPKPSKHDTHMHHNKHISQYKVANAVATSVNVILITSR